MQPFFIRDPVYDYITIERPVIRDLLACPEIQRLRRIRQLGFSLVTYPGAEHSRFTHSLGVYHLMTEAVTHLRNDGLRFDRLAEDAAIAAALLHDIGHGPFSHCMERAMGSSWPGHEEITRSIVRDTTPVRTVLRRRSKELPDLVWLLLKGEPEPTPVHKVIHGLLDGNFDLDRLDFIARDSVFTGVRIEHVDARRIINTLKHDKDNVLMVKAKGQTAMEEFLVARHFMYSAVYFHKTTRGMEAVFLAWVRRIRDPEVSPLPKAFVSSPLGDLLLKPFSLPTFFGVDDADVYVVAKGLERGRDKVLRDLSRRLLRRQPLRVVAGNITDAQRLREAMEYLDTKTEYPAEYYFHIDAPSDVPYDLRPYWEDPGLHRSDPIFVEVEGQPIEITQRSPLVRALTSEDSTPRIYVPQERRDAVKRILQ